MFKLREKVWITNTNYIDGHFDRGIIVGVDMVYDGLGYMTEKQYFNDFQESMYKVAYVNSSTNKAHQEWINYRNLSKTEPVKLNNR